MKKRWPWIAVAAGIVIAAAVVMILLKSRKLPSPDESDALPGATREKRSPTPEPVEDTSGHAKIQIDVDAGKGITMEFLLVKAGKFMMGSMAGDADERPVHELVITGDFWMQSTEVTQAQWEAVIGSNPSECKGPDLPVEQVNWEDCQEFLKKLNEMGRLRRKGRTALLPTEAEWEYACRAGSTGKWAFGDDEAQVGEYAWYDKNSGGKPQPVARKKPNEFGLFDMHGNVWEWCQDWYGEYGVTVTDGSAWTIRGGCWLSPANRTRSAVRCRDYPGGRGLYVGIRVALR